MKEILDILNQSKIAKIHELAKEVGFNNVRVFKSPLAADEERLNFLITISEKYSEKVTLENSGLLQWKLQKLLKSNNFSIMQDDQLEETFKDDILANAIVLSVENMPKIKQVFGFLNTKPIIANGPKLSIKKGIEGINLIINIPKIGLSESEEERSEEYYINSALDYLTSIKKRKQENDTQKIHNTSPITKLKKNS